MALKLLVFADSHSNLASIKALRDYALKEKPDAIVSLGDLTNEGLLDIGVEAFEILYEKKFSENKETGKKHAAEALSALSETKTRLYFIPGNQDKKEITEFLESRNASLHKKAVDLNGVALIGLGGAKPVNVIYIGTNLGELEAKKTLHELFEASKGKKIILCTHAPPAGLKTSKSFKGIDLGVKAIHDAIKEFRPLLHVCGHVHESFGEEMIDGIESINIGPLKDGYCLLVEEKGGKISWERKKLF